MKVPNWQHHSKKESKRTLKPQAVRDATNRRVLHTNLSDCEKLADRRRKLSDFVDNYENVLKGEVDSYSSTFLKKELKKRVSLLIDEEVDNLDNAEFSDAL